MKSPLRLTVTTGTSRTGISRLGAGGSTGGAEFKRVSRQTNREGIGTGVGDYIAPEIRQIMLVHNFRYLLLRWTPGDRLMDQGWLQDDPAALGCV